MAAKPSAAKIEEGDRAEVRRQREMSDAKLVETYSRRVRDRLKRSLDTDAPKEVEIDGEYFLSVIEMLCGEWKIPVETLAKHVGISRSTVFRWKNGGSPPKRYAFVGLIYAFLELLEEKHGTKRLS